MVRSRSNMYSESLYSVFIILMSKSYTNPIFNRESLDGWRDGNVENLILEEK